MRSTIPSLLALAVVLGGACGGDSPGGGGPDATGATDTASPTDTSAPFDTTSRPNSAPEFERIGDRVAAVGVPLAIVVNARDADGDALSYSLYGTLPEGARFDKAARRFDWTPTTVGQVVFLTFVVSDGQAFDRETVRIEVLSEAAAHPPVFAPVGDQQLTVGRAFTLDLEATDPDGDTLTFGFERQLPGDATLDAATGRFLWTPAAADAGVTHRVTFTVSDGELSDSLTVKLLVGDGQTGGPQPPVFTQLPPQTATVGVELSFTLLATDPNGDPLTYAVVSGAPAGSALDGAVFRWTPGTSDTGKSYDVRFSASDGALTAVTTVKINVANAAGSCTIDPGEPNDDYPFATAITPGTYQRSICDQPGNLDLADVYAIAVPPDTRLVATLTFDPALGDLDLFLDDDQHTLVYSELATSPEQLAWNEVEGRTLYLVVLPFTGDELKVPYTLEVAFTAPTAACVDDAFEDNDTPATAKAPPADGTPLQICGGDPDWWKFPVTCGQRIEIGMEISGDADLDLRLFATPDAGGAPIAWSYYDDPFEIIDVPKAPSSGTYVLEVSGYPAESAEAAYSLLIATSGGCVEDQNPNNGSSATATTLSGTAGTQTGLVVCCRRDWFAIDLPQAASATFSATRAGGTGKLELAVFGSDGVTQLTAQPLAAADRAVTLSGQAAGRRYVRVGGEIGAGYTLSWTVTTGSGCTYASCDVDDICDVSAGICSYNDCEEDTDCPGGLSCRDSFCLNPCQSSGDCRVGFACKTFDVGKRCGLVGTGAAGTNCFWFPDCAGSLICSSEGKCVQR